MKASTKRTLQYIALAMVIVASIGNVLIGEYWSAYYCLCIFVALFFWSMKIREVIELKDEIERLNFLLKLRREDADPVPDEVIEFIHPEKQSNNRRKA